MFKNIKSTTTKNNIFEYLLILWIISLPFGASLFPISLGAFTIYPNLIISIIIGSYSIITFKKWNRFEWLVLAFYLVWIFIAGLVFINKTSNSFALFDLRSLIMQLIFFVVFLNTNYLLSFSKIRDFLQTGFKSYFFVLLIFGFFEFFTGIHFDGNWVDKFVNLQVNNIFYAPIFIYDNSNDFLCYLVYFYLLNLLFDKSLQLNFYHKLLYLLIIFIFAQYADSKFAKIIVLTLIFFELFFELKKHLTINRKNNIIIATIILLVPLYFNSNKFYGPMFNKGCNYKLNEIKFFKRNNHQIEVFQINQNTSREDKRIMLQKIDSLENSVSSISVRKNLILNGLDFIKEQPILGIGPGGFVQRHIDHKIQNETDTVTNPHNFIIEIISQFGIIGWGYFTLLIFLFIQFFRNKSTTFSKKYGLVLICILPILWMMPSSYLYLDINWLLLPIIYFQFNAAN